MDAPIIFLDPGHGGINPATAQYETEGKRARHPGKRMHRAGWFYEGVFNRSACRAIEARLRELGFSRITCTVPKEALWQDTPLSLRAAYANSVWRAAGCPPSLLLSIHANWYSYSSVSGYELFTSPGQTAADRFASLAGGYLDAWYSAYIPRLRADYSDGDLDKEAGFKILGDTAMPACLAELGFMSNPGDAEQLLRPECQAAAASALAVAALEFFSLQ